MKIRFPLSSYWRKLSITTKFSLAFAILLVLIVLVALTGFWALAVVRRQTEATIATSIEIQRLVLEMDESLQTARRFERDFFLRWPVVGFEEARQNYAIPHQEQIAEVIRTSTTLRQLAAGPNVSDALRQGSTELTTYVPLVNLYASTFNRTVDLVAELDTPEDGVLPRLQQSSDRLYNSVRAAEDAQLTALYRQTQAFEKDYLLTRERPKIQSAFNTLRTLRQGLADASGLDENQRTEALANVDTYEDVARELLAIDNEIHTLQNGFDLQATSVDPIANELLRLANAEVGQARQQIARTSQFADTLLTLSVLGAVALAAITALLLNKTITRNVVKLTETAVELQQGNLQARVHIDSADELGQLADTFNTMVARIAGLVDNLEDQAAIAQTRLLEAIESISEGFSLYDADDRLILCNNKYRDMQVDIDDLIKPGVRFEELARAGAERGCYPAAVGRVDEWVRERVQQHRHPHGPFAQQLSDGRWLQISEYETADGGIVGISTDITERKHAEEALRHSRDVAESANRAKSQFLANMSHELRTPLNAIIGYSEMLEEEAGDEGLSEFVPDLQRINTAGKHLLAIISDILDLSKIEAGKMDLYLETFDIAGMVKDVVTTIQPLVGKNDNSLEVHISDEIGTMHADLTKVRQTLFNLLSNAAKFTQQGQITLTVSREETPLDLVDDKRWEMSLPEQILFTVTDTGIGMSLDQIHKLFDAFAQADASTTRKYGGTGLGLAISWRFCQMMGGTIIVKSELGHGSTFTVRLPAQVGKSTVEPVTSDETTPPDKSAAGIDRAQAIGTVLVIDDDPDVRDLMRRFLNKEGFWVETAAGGEAGLRLARELHPTAITLDVMMPGMDGWAVLTALKADPALADIPIIMMTMLDNKNMGYALGASEYLTKPIDRSRLVAILNRYCASGRCSVLVVEDDTVTREMVRRMLTKEGWAVAEAENGRVALEQVAKEKPELILLDLMMPEMDGFQFIAELRQNPAWRAIPIIVVTAMELTEQDQQRLNGYVKQILQKGLYSRDELLHEVYELVSACVAPMRVMK